MNSPLYQVKDDLNRLNFAVCNLGPDLFPPQLSDPLRFHQSSSIVPSFITSPTNKPKVSVPPLSMQFVGKNKIMTKQRKPSKNFNLIYGQPSEENNETTKRSILDQFSGNFQLYSLNNIQRVNTNSRMITSAALSQRLNSHMRTSSMAENAIIKETPAEESVVLDSFHQKFHKRYDHFRKSQNNVFNQYLQKFKKMSETKNQTSGINMNLGYINNNGQEVDLMLSKAFPNEKDRVAFLQKKAKEFTRIKRKILDGEIVDFSKCYTDRKTAINSERVKEKDICLTDRQPFEEHLKSQFFEATTNTWSRIQATTLTSNQSFERDKMRTTNEFPTKEDEIKPLKEQNIIKKFAQLEKEKSFVALKHRRGFSLYDATNQQSEYYNSSYQEKISPFTKRFSVSTVSPKQVPESLRASMIKSNECYSIENSVLNKSPKGHRGPVEAKIIKPKEKETELKKTYTRLKKETKQVKVKSWGGGIVSLRQLCPNKPISQPVISEKAKKNNNKVPERKVKKLFVSNKGTFEKDSFDFALEGWDSEYKGLL